MRTKSLWNDGLPYRLLDVCDQKRHRKDMMVVVTNYRRSCKRAHLIYSGDGLSNEYGPLKPSDLKSWDLGI